jgi:hypothetical protein
MRTSLLVFVAVFFFVFCPAWVCAQDPVKVANTEAKLLLLTHAFEGLGALRVELKTHALNLQSRRAIARLGAVEEGTLRKRLIVPTLVASAIRSSSLSWTPIGPR